MNGLDPAYPDDHAAARRALRIALAKAAHCVRPLLERDAPPEQIAAGIVAGFMVGLPTGSILGVRMEDGRIGIMHVDIAGMLLVAASVDE
jgi:hypothetical protein